MRRARAGAPALKATLTCSESQLEKLHAAIICLVVVALRLHLAGSVLVDSRGDRIERGPAAGLNLD